MTSELSEERDGKWNLISDGDAADGKVLELIGGVRTGRGASKAEHWGLLRYLWARQGEAADWPEWEDEAGAGARIRAGLAQVDIDPLLELLRAQFWEAQGTQFTTTGRVSKNSPLQIAEQTVEELESELADVRANMEQADRDLQELQQLRGVFEARGREKAEAEKKARGLTDVLRQVELLQKDLERFEGAFAGAEKQLNAIHEDKESLGKAKDGLEATEKERDRRKAEEQRTRREEKENREALTSLNNSAKALQKKLDSARRSEERLREIGELYELEEDLAKLRKSLDAARSQQDVLSELRRKRAAMPDVKKRQVARLEQRERELRELAVRAESIGLRVSMEPERSAVVSVDRDGAEETIKLAKDKATTVTAARNLRLKLPEWGEISITSGAQEAAKIENQIAASRAALEKDLKQLSVASVDHARTCAEQVRDLNRDIKTAKSLLAERLNEWESLESLQAGVEKAEGDAEQRRARLNLSEEETAFSRAELKAKLAMIRTTIGADEKEQIALQGSIESQGQHVEKCAVKREEASKSVNQAKTCIASLEARRKTVNERYPESIEKAETGAQTAFVAAKAELEVARKKLPEDSEKLGPRQERALNSASQATQEYQDADRKIRRLETLLDHVGSTGAL